MFLIQHPLIDKGRIIKRQDVVQVFLDISLSGSDVRQMSSRAFMILNAWYVSFGKDLNPKDLLLHSTLSHVPQIRAILND